MHVVIDRSKWRTGQYGTSRTGEGNTLLLNEEGYKCCIGFACNAAGVSDKSIRGMALPWELHEKHHSVRRKLLSSNICVNSRDDYSSVRITEAEWVGAAVNNNDSAELTPRQREHRIRMNFRKGGHTVEFVGEYEK